MDPSATPTDQATDPIRRSQPATLPVDKIEPTEAGEELSSSYALTATAPDAGDISTVNSGRPARRRSSFAIIFSLILLTIVGGALRFTALDRPTIWGDEAATFGRIAGTHRQLLDQLNDGGSLFMPLHYELYWWIANGFPYWGHLEPRDVTVRKVAENGRSTFPKRTIYDYQPTHRLVPEGVTMTPSMMRIVPAIAGTLMIPAIYFFARQLFGARLALLAAGLCATSDYLLIYSRDAKMYMHFWLMCTLHMGCLLWWLRSRSVTGWLCWLVTGVAMIGLHAPGLMLAIPGLVILLTVPRPNYKGFWTIIRMLGWVLVLPAAVVHDLVAKKAGWIRWFSSRSFFSWPLKAWRGFRCPPLLPYLAGLGVMLSLLVGPLGFYTNFRPTERLTEDDGKIDVGEAGIGWVAEYNQGRSFGDLLLYTASAYLTGWEWPRQYDVPKIDHQKFVDPLALKLLKVGTVALLALLAVGLVPWPMLRSARHRRAYTVATNDRVPVSFVRRRVLWLGVYLVVVGYCVYAVAAPRPVSILDAVSTAVLDKPPPAGWPRLERLPLLSVSLTSGDSQMTPGKLPPDANGRRPWIFARPHRSPQETVDTSKPGDGSESFAVVWQKFREEARQTWRVYIAAFGRQNVSTLKVLITGLLILGIALMLIFRRRTRAGAWRLASAGAVVGVLCTFVGLMPQLATESVWMPRYVAVVLPAFVLVTACLIVRQPHRYLRLATIALFVAINLTQYYQRVFAHGGPPVDQMAADVAMSDSNSSPSNAISSNPTIPPSLLFSAEASSTPTRTRTRVYFVEPFPDTAAPGGGTVFNSAGNYYLSLYAPKEVPVRDVRDNNYDQHFDIHRVVNERQIERDLERNPTVERVIVWSKVPRGTTDVSGTLSERLGKMFKKVQDKSQPAYDHWTWELRWSFRRQVFERRSGRVEDAGTPAAQ